MKKNVGAPQVSERELQSQKRRNEAFFLNSDSGFAFEFLGAQEEGPSTSTAVTGGNLNDQESNLLDLLQAEDAMQDPLITDETGALSAAVLLSEDDKKLQEELLGGGTGESKKSKKRDPPTAEEVAALFQNNLFVANSFLKVPPAAIPKCRASFAAALERFSKAQIREYQKKVKERAKRRKTKRGRGGESDSD
jgi:hypothetical protein